MVIEGEQTFYNLYESIKDGIVSVDLDGRITGANQAYLDMLGFSLQEIRKLTYQQITPKKWHAMEQEIVDSKLAEREYSDEYEKEYVRKDGSVFPISIRTWLIKGDSGAPIGMWAIVRDITERKTYEKKLEEARENWARTFDATSEAMFLVEEDLNILQHNKAFARLVGRDGEELSGNKCYELVHNLSAVPDFCVTCAAIEEKKTVNAELFEPHLDKYLDAAADPTFDAEGNFEFVLHTIRDVTERKKYEEALRRSEEHYRLLFNNAAEAIFSYDSELILTDINRLGCEAIGYSREELVGKNILELGILHPDDIENAADAIRRHFDGEDVVESEFTMIRKDGAERLFTMIGAVTRNPDGNVQSITNICRDITEERHIEEALRRTQFTVDQSADSVFWVTSKGKIIFANDEACRRRGYTKEEILSLTIFDINVGLAADPGIWESQCERIQREGHFVSEFQHRTRDGDVFPVEASLNFFELEDDWLFVANVRDITERKAAEEALRESEEGFRQFADNLPEIVFEADSLGRLVYVNSNALEVGGYTEEELYSGSVSVMEMISEEYREQAVQRIQKILSEGYQGSSEYMARRKDGSTFPAIVSVLPVVKDGITVGLRGVLTDITAQKEVEEALKRVNEELDGYAHVV
ncbi:MAG: PAS domain-containing protein, partial [Candidatus Geothermincolia bacterium]